MNTIICALLMNNSLRSLICFNDKTNRAYISLKTNNIRERYSYFNARALNVDLGSCAEIYPYYLPGSKQIKAR